MSDDVEKEIKEIFEKSRRKKGEKERPVGIAVGDITGNSGTVVIGGNINQGRREEDRPDADESSHGRRASDHKLHRELRQLRQQVGTLVDLVDRLQKKQAECLVTTCKNSVGKTGVKRDVKVPFPVRHSVRKLCDATPENCPIYLTRRRSKSATSNRSESPVIAGSVPSLPRLFIGSPAFPILSVPSHQSREVTAGAGGLVG